MNKIGRSLYSLSRQRLFHFKQVSTSARYFSSQEFVKLDNPYTGEQIEEVPFLTKEEQIALVHKSKEAQIENNKYSLKKRKQIVQGVIDYLATNKELIATDITRQMGKPIVQSREEIDYSIERINALQDLANSALAPEVVQQTQNITKTIIKEPLGIVLILSSFDFPVLSAVNHMIPAILSGNSVLLKDNPRTPLIGKHLEAACGTTGLALRFFANQSQVKEVYKMHDIKYVVFMGSLESASDVYEEVAENDFIDCQLDLGGKDAAYVAPDCNMDLALKEILKGSFYNSGQSRNSIQRIYVHKEISNDFINQFSKKAFEELKLGDPMKEDTNIGPIAMLEIVEHLQELCSDAVNMSGLIVLGGNTNTDENGLGRFFEPTIITNSNNGMRIQSDQFMGPIVTFQEVEDEFQARNLINSTRFGIASSIFTQNPVLVDYFTERLKVGVVNVNQCPRMQDHFLPVTGRKVCQKILYNSKYVFDNFTKLKSLNIRMDF